ncbi:MAG: GNAT family N-acetyltransferase [Gammaproteobacteria bacterium]|nr:GNAT family N-acetyltransferase [Gammaproteobacteria bacterium]
MHLEVLSSISQVKAHDWNLLFAHDYPFCRYEFLHALEVGGSVGAGTGWQPQHLLLWDGEQLVAAAPAYLKQHSYGEYLFDRVFAEAYQRYRLRYYPKLLLAVPFTPAEGPRIGIGQGVDAALVIPWLQQYLDATDIPMNANNCTTALGQLSHWQCLYPGKSEQALFRAAGWLERFDVQFEWQNKHYQSFEHFLAALSARKRKQIRKERSVVQQQGIQLRTLSGPDLDSTFWQQFYQFYVATYLKRSGHQGYLTAETFALWGAQLTSHIVIFSAWDGDNMVAASLCFRSNEKLYGRYWGCTETYDRLHFECCYYSGIQYCIEQGLQAFDAGAQGEHKLQRGFEPVIRTGFYRFKPAATAPDAPQNSGLTTEQQPIGQAELMQSMHSAIANYCLDEQSMVLNYQQQALAALPFAQLTPAGDITAVIITAVEASSPVKNDDE